MKINNIIISFIIYFINFTIIMRAIQIHENTTSDNNNKNNTNFNIEQLSESLININSKGPVLYPNELENVVNNLQNMNNNSSIQNNNTEWLKKNNQNVNNITSSVKKTLGKLKKQKLRQTNIDSSRSIQFKHNYVNNQKEFIPSPEIKLSSSSSEEKINQIKENDSFQPSDILMPLSVSIETVKPFINTKQQYYTNNNKQNQQQQHQPQYQQQHKQQYQQQQQQQSKNLQYLHANNNNINQKNNQYQYNNQMTDNISEKDIVYGKQDNENSQLSKGYNYKQNQQTKNNNNNEKLKNNLINWPSNGNLQEVTDSNENHKEKTHTKKSAVNFWHNKNQYHQSNPNVQEPSSIYYDENIKLPETKILIHSSNNDILHDIYNNPNNVEDTKELIENHYYTNPHQQQVHHYQQHQQVNTLPIASEHPYQFETVSGKDAQYYEYQNIGIGQHNHEQQLQQHQHQHQQQQEQLQQHQQYGQHYQHNTQHYENVYSNENVGVISNYGETSGHSNYGEIGSHYQQENAGYHNVRHNHHYGHNIGNDLKKLVHWKKIATIFASIIPIGLLFSALTPNVVVINPNATALSKSPSPITLVQPNRQRSLDVDKKQKNNINNSTIIKTDLKGIHLDLISNKNISLNSKCIERSICELASDGNNSYILQKLLEEIQRNYRRDLFSSAALSTSLATQFTEEEFNKAAKGDNCKNYECDMLT